MKNYKFCPYLIIKDFVIVLTKLGLLILLGFTFFLNIPLIIVCYLFSYVSQPLTAKIATLMPYICWSIFDLIFRLTCTVEKKSIKKDNYLVISNHISAVDFVLINSINEHMFSYSKYCFKKSLMAIPVFYQACQILNYLILERNYEKDEIIIQKYVENIKKHKDPIWFVLFCEGSRFTENKLNESNDFCKSKGIEPFRNVLCPRYKGFAALQKGFSGLISIRF